VITVADNGIGISAENKKHLFKRGFGKDTEFGLFLSWEILSITGISISETGVPGTGAQFEITVPEGAFRFTERDSTCMIMRPFRFRPDIVRSRKSSEVQSYIIP
jgi:K+-sensing histidine kinase KdpD